MMRETLLVSVVLLSAGLAGCVTTDPGASGVQEDLRSDLVLQDCTEQLGLFYIPASQAEPYLPEGFEPLVLNLEGMIVAEGMASVVILALACQGGDGGEAFRQVSVNLGVVPSEAYENKETWFHAVHVASITQGRSVRSTLEAWGIPQLLPGEIVVDAEALSTLGGRQVATADDNGTGLTLTTTTAVPMEEPPGTSRVFGVDNGTVTGIVDRTWSTEVEEPRGEALVENRGLMPFEVDGPGFGAYATVPEVTYMSVALPGADADADVDTNEQERST